MARQQHIHTEKEDYYIDLVFYNYILKCFVLIDLKTKKITHQDVGQMDMYVRMYDELKKAKDDNPTIGIVLCSETDEDIAKYSVLKGNEQLFASKYKLYLPTEDELRAEIETQKAIFELQQQNKQEYEKFILVKPTLDYKESAIEYINEFYEYNSQIHGTGGLDIALEKGISYEDWLSNSIKMYNKEYAYSKGKVPAVTYFLVRKNDNKIVGTIDLRLELNDYLRNYGGHIGYSIRPTERRKGYNKINLYLCLLEAQKNGLEKVLITCADYNTGSRNSIKSFDGVLEKTTYDESDGETMELYWIDLNNAINKYRNEFEKFIEKDL